MSTYPALQGYSLQIPLIQSFIRTCVEHLPVGRLVGLASVDLLDSDWHFDVPRFLILSGVGKVTSLQLEEAQAAEMEEFETAAALSARIEELQHVQTGLEAALSQTEKEIRTLVSPDDLVLFLGPATVSLSQAASPLFTMSRSTLVIVATVKVLSQS